MATKIGLLKFDNKEAFPGKLAEMKDHFAKSGNHHMLVHSQFDTENKKNANMLSYTIFQALRIYAGLDEGFYGEVPSGYIAELPCNSKDEKGNLIEERQVCFINKHTREVYAGYVNEKTGMLRGGYQLYEKTTGKGHSVALFVTALLPIIFMDEEVKSAWEEIEAMIKTSPDDDFWDIPITINDGQYTKKDFFAWKLAIITDSVYRRHLPVNQHILPKNLSLELKLITNADIKTFASGMLKNKITNMHGNPHVFITAAETLKYDNLVLERNIPYTEEEKLLVPDLPDWYVPFNALIELCQMFVDSSAMPAPIRTAYLVGPAGTGKTEAVRAACHFLNIPIDHITCDEGTDMFRFMGEIIPNVSGGNTSKSDAMELFETERAKMNLPSIEDIMADPQTAYVKIFRKKPDVALLEEDMINEVIKKVNFKIQSLMKSMDFTFVESGLVKAIKNGYGFEIQEAGVIRKPGVLVGLNSWLESGHNNYMTLATGEIVKKHENCCIFFTSNDGYEGTRILNQSVLSRAAITLWFDNPTPEVMASRVKKRTGFEDTATLNKMAEIIAQINEFCAKEGISDGVCGPRELENWAMALMSRKKRLGLSNYEDILRETAQITVVNKVSQCQEDIQKVMDGLIDAHLGSYEMYVKM